MNYDIYNIGNKTMQYLMAIKNYKNITAAANSLYISQPALSKYLQNLESRLGIQLFNRIGYQFYLTYEGERFLEYAQRIISLEQCLSDEITSWKTEYMGRLRIALPSLRSQYLLPKFVPIYRKKYPNVELQIYEESSNQLEDMLAEGAVDFAILNFEPKRPDTVVLNVRKDPLYLAVPADHPLTSAGIYTDDSEFPKIDLQLFRDEPFILQSPAQRTRQIANQIFQREGITPKILFVLKSIEASVNLVGQGCGVCFLAETYVRNLHVPISPKYFSLLQETPMIYLGIAYNKNIYMPQHFTDFLRIAAECI